MFQIRIQILESHCTGFGYSYGCEIISGYLTVLVRDIEFLGSCIRDI